MATEPPEGVFEPPHSNGAVHQSGAARARVRRRRIILVVGGLIAAAWIFALVYSVTVTTHSPERLAVADATALSGICTAAQRQLQALPNPNPLLGADRVTRIHAEDAVLQTMIAKFSSVIPHGATPAKALRSWSEDWTNVVVARERYARDLAATATTGGKALFVLPATGGVKPITDRMDDFVRENHPNLNGCFTNALQLEVTERQRTYTTVTG